MQKKKYVVPGEYIETIEDIARLCMKKEKEIGIDGYDMAVIEQIQHYCNKAYSDNRCEDIIISNDNYVILKQYTAFIINHDLYDKNESLQQMRKLLDFLNKQ